MNNEFHPLTIKYLESTELDHRKRLGQYFTPKSVREKLLNQLPKIKNAKILDPACGTGEFLLSAKKYFEKPQLYGWDIDQKLIDIAREMNHGSNLKNLDSLKQPTDIKFDFIIGNPPYFEFKLDKELKTKYDSVVTGRPNIFALFIKQGLDLLKEGGYLAFVLPPSMNNGAYFKKLRKYIIENSNIEYLEILKNSDLFYEAQQLVMLLVLKKGKNSGDYIFSHNGIQIFSQNHKYLKESFLDKKTLSDLGFKVRTGRLVWNQNKHLLTDDPNGSVKLIWSHNIGKDGKLNLVKKIGKPQFVKIDNYDCGPAIIVNRTTGAAHNAKIRAVLISSGDKFIAENHCNVIFPPDQNFFNNRHLTMEILLEQLTSPEKLEIIRNITGNTQVSKTELEKLFPLNLVF